MRGEGVLGVGAPGGAGAGWRGQGQVLGAGAPGGAGAGQPAGQGDGSWTPRRTWVRSVNHAVKKAGLKCQEKSQ